MLVSELLSGIASTGLVLATNGTPESVMFSASVQPMLTRAFDVIIPDILNKNVTKREAERLGISYKSAIDVINENVDRGLPLRDDDIFIRSDGHYSKADDILETLLKKSMDDTEEKKAKYYGYFFGNLPFCPEVNYRQAFLIQRIIPQLTYSHLCLIKLVYERNKLATGKWKNKTNNEVEVNIILIYHQTKELLQADILTQVPPYNLGNELGNLKLSSLGNAIYKLLKIKEIPEEDVKDTKRVLDILCQ